MFTKKALSLVAASTFAVFGMTLFAQTATDRLPATAAIGWPWQWLQSRGRGAASSSVVALEGGGSVDANLCGGVYIDGSSSKSYPFDDSCKNKDKKVGPVAHGYGFDPNSKSKATEQAKDNAINATGAADAQSACEALNAPDITSDPWCTPDGAPTVKPGWSCKIGGHYKAYCELNCIFTQAFTFSLDGVEEFANEKGEDISNSVLKPACLAKKKQACPKDCKEDTSVTIPAYEYLPPPQYELEKKMIGNVQKTYLKVTAYGKCQVAACIDQ